MNFGEIKKLVIAEYDSRDLVASNRYRELEKFDSFLKQNGANLWDDVSKFPTDKERMKLAYAKILEKKLNQAESSMINEVYHQLAGQGIKLTDYSKIQKDKTIKP